MRTIVLVSIALALTALSSCKKDEVVSNKNKSEEILSGKGGGGAPQNLTLGQKYGGGYIFYLDITGQHGLISAERNLGRVAWSIAKPTKATGATSMSDGNANTKRIIQVYGNVPNYATTYAAKACKDFRGGGYQDWYLPSVNELTLLYQNRTYAPGFELTFGYWTSTEESFIVNAPNANYSRVHYLDAYYGGGVYIFPSYEPLLVMPIRKF